MAHCEQNIKKWNIFDKQKSCDYEKAIEVKKARKITKIVYFQNICSFEKCHFLKIVSNGRDIPFLNLIQSNFSESFMLFGLYLQKLEDKKCPKMAQNVQ